MIIKSSCNYRLLFLLILIQHYCHVSLRSIIHNLTVLHNNILTENNELLFQFITYMEIISKRCELHWRDQAVQLTKTREANKAENPLIP